jgi:hypothetical protein
MDQMDRNESRVGELSAAAHAAKPHACSPPRSQDSRGGWARSPIQVTWAEGGPRLDCVEELAIAGEERDAGSHNVRQVDGIVDVPPYLQGDGQRGRQGVHRLHELAGQLGDVAEDVVDRPAVAELDRQLRLEPEHLREPIAGACPST